MLRETEETCSLNKAEDAGKLETWIRMESGVRIHHITLD